MELCLFDDASGAEVERITLPEYTTEIGHGYPPGVGPGTLSAIASTALRMALGSIPPS